MTSKSVALPSLASSVRPHGGRQQRQEAQAVGPVA